jgi:hypothetical protein
MRYDHPEARRLRKHGRIAIWNRERIIFVFAMAIWVTDISLLINGKHLLQIMGESLVNLVTSQVLYR